MERRHGRRCALAALSIAAVTIAAQALGEADAVSSEVFARLGGQIFRSHVLYGSSMESPPHSRRLTSSLSGYSLRAGARGWGSSPYPTTALAPSIDVREADRDPFRADGDFIDLVGARAQVVSIIDGFVRYRQLHEFFVPLRETPGWQEATRLSGYWRQQQTLADLQERAWRQSRDLFDLQEARWRDQQALAEQRWRQQGILTDLQERAWRQSSVLFGLQEARWQDQQALAEQRWRQQGILADLQERTWRQSSVPFNLGEARWRDQKALTERRWHWQNDLGDFQDRAWRSSLALAELREAKQLQAGTNQLWAQKNSLADLQDRAWGRSEILFHRRVLSSPHSQLHVIRLGHQQNTLARLQDQAWRQVTSLGALQDRHWRSQQTRLDHLWRQQEVMGASRTDQLWLNQRLRTEGMERLTERRILLDDLRLQGRALQDRSLADGAFSMTRHASFGILRIPVRLTAPLHVYSSALNALEIGSWYRDTLIRAFSVPRIPYGFLH